MAHPIKCLTEIDLSETTAFSTGETNETAAMRGDRDAMQKLWHAHRRWIAAVLLTHKPREVDLEDLLQEVAMTMVRKIHTIRESTNVRAWLRTVAINTARATARSLNARPKSVQSEITAECSDSDAHESASTSEYAQKVLHCARQLPEIYREPLMLRTLHGFRSKEVAALLEIPPATVDTRVARARRMLREMISGTDDQTHNNTKHTLQSVGINNGAGGAP